MSCFPELTYSIYLDGELPAAETRQVQQHLQECVRCHSLVEALRHEGLLLTELLQQTEELPGSLPVSSRATRPLDVLWTGLAVLGVATALKFAVGFVSGLEAPAGAEWLNPFSVAVQWNLFFSSLFYFIQEGAAMLLSNMISISILTVTLLGLLAGAYLARRRPSVVSLLATLALMLAVALPGSALESRKGKAVSVATDETIDDTLLIHGENVQIDGTITGNLIAFSERLSIKGTVKGDVVSFAQTLDMDGTVEGNIFSFAQWLNLRGHIAGTVFSWSQRIQLEPSGSVDADLLSFTADANLDGPIARDAMLFAGMATVPGAVGRNLKVRAGKLTVPGSARVGGDLTVYCKKARNVQIDPKASIAGKTNVSIRQPEESEYFSPRFYFRKILGLAVIFLLGLALFWLFPAFRAAAIPGGGQLAKTAGVGFLALVAPPVAAGLLFIVLIGIGVMAGVVLIATLVPLLITILWLLTLYLSKAVVGLAIGRVIAKEPAERAARVAMPLLVGLVIVYVLINLPFVGHVLNFLVWLVGLGIGVLLAWRKSAPATA